MQGSHLPYSRLGLENLAAALNIQSGSLFWLNPTTTRLELRQPQAEPAPVAEVAVETEERGDATE